MTALLPAPDDPDSLEWMVTRFARQYLHDPLANLYRRKGHAQHGVDVLARDGRPNGGGALWAFDAKFTQQFEPADLQKQLGKLQGSPLRKEIRCYVIVTTAPNVVRAQDAAANVRNLRVAVWGWPEFSREAATSGLGAWLSTAQRREARAAWCKRLSEDFKQARVLYPLPTEVPLHEAWMNHAPSLRAEARTRADGTSTGAETSGAGDLRYWLTDSSWPLLLVVGPMGGGKTVGLLRAGWEEANQIGAIDRPLPLRLEAHELLGDGSLSARIGRILERSCPEAKDLWTDPGTDWWIWIDGADELRTARDLGQVEQAARTLSALPRVRKVVLCCRDTIERQLLTEVRRVVLGLWSPASSRRLAKRVSQRPGRLLLGRLERPATPLVATLAALHPDAHGSGPAAEAVLRGVLRGWIGRHGEPMARDLRRGLEEFALLRLLDGRGARAVSGLLGLERAGEVLDDGVSQGLLRRERGDGCAFVDAHLQTWLAACAVVRRRDDELLDWRSEPRLREALWLAVARIRAEDRSRALALLPRLLDRSADDPDLQLDGLDLALDLLQDDVDPSLLDRVAERLAQGVQWEARPWFGDELVDRLQRFVRLGDEAWRAVWSRLEPWLRIPGRRADILAIIDLPRNRCLELLQEPSPSVRAAAVRKLRAWLDDEETLQTLFWMLLDAGFELAFVPPAMEAGLALREVGRRAEVVSSALPWLDRGQLVGGAAALALRPGEAEVVQVLRALHQADAGFYANALREAARMWRSQPGGEAWLQAHWPEVDAKRQPSNEAPIEGLDGQLSPSEDGRRRVLRGLAPGLYRRGGDAVRLLWREPELVVELCRVAEDHPAPVTELLREHKHLFIRPAGQVALGEAALRHPDIEQALVDAWSRVSPPSSYPGFALEPLIRRSPERQELQQIYATWLPDCPFLGGLGSWHAPAEDVLLLPTIQAAATALVEHLWAWSTVGHPNPEKGRLSERTLGWVLAGLPRIWQSHPGIEGGLLQRAVHDEQDWLLAALIAWQHGPPPELVGLAGRKADGRWRLREEVWWGNDVVTLLLALRRAGASAVVSDLAQEILDAGWPYGAVPAALVRGADPALLPTCSERVAGLWPRCQLHHRGEPEDLLRLVAVQPGLWAERAHDMLEDHGLRVITDVLAILRQLVTLELPPAADRAVDKMIARFAQAPLCWFEEPWQWGAVNAADQATRLRRLRRG